MLSRGEAGRLLETPDIRYDVKTWIVLRQFADHGVF
jgi:hypothetical protein